MTKIRVLIADDHAIVRTGVRTYIDSQSDMEVVAEGDNGRVAVELAKEHKPDVAVLDVTMPEVNGVEAIGKLKEVSPTTRTIVLTMHDDQALVRAVLAAGGAGYVVKSSAADELISAIRAVHEGRSYLNVSLADGELRNVLTGSSASGLAPQPYNPLSRRENEVLTLLVKGFSYKEIASQLHLSVKTVGSHRAHIGEKLGIKSRAELMRYATAMGILDTGKAAADD